MFLPGNDLQYTDLIPMIKRYDKVLSKRLRPLYIASFFQGFVLWYAIEKLFMKSIGFSDAMVAVETVIFTIVMLAVNIPMGIIADRWSRKGVLMIASIALMASSFTCGISNGFWVYALGASFWGIFYACYIGCYDSVVYDVLIEVKGEATNFEHYYGRVQLFDGIALILGSFLNSVVVHYFNLRAAYFLTIPLTVGSLIVLHYFTEPKEHKKEVSQLLDDHIKTTFRAIAQKGEIFWIVFTLVMITIEMRLVFELDQLWLIALALPAIFYGPVNALLLSSISSGGIIAGKIRNKIPVILVGLAVFLSSLALLTRYRLLIIIAQTVLLTGLIVLNIIFSRYLHDTLPSKIRVGASSVVTTVGYIAFLPMGLLFGLISKYFNIFHAAWIVVTIAAAMIMGIWVVTSTRDNSANATEH